MNQLPDYAVTKNYSLTMVHIAKVADMAQRTGRPQGEIVRNAIDLLYETLEANPSKIDPNDQSAPTIAE